MQSEHDSEHTRYDAMNRRIRKEVFGGGLSGTIPNNTLDYLYTGWQCCEERKITGSTETLFKQYLWGIYIDELIQQQTYDTINGNVAGEYYPLQDLLYRTTALTDSTATIVETYDTDAYGNTLIFTSAGTGGNWWADDAVQSDYPTCDFIFTGRRLDAETFLYNYRLRYYLPALGRFLSRDPIKRRGRSVGTTRINIVVPQRMPYDEQQLHEASADNPTSNFTLGNPETYNGRAVNYETGLYGYASQSFQSVFGSTAHWRPVDHDETLRNLYQYVNSQPIHSLDPSGLKRTPWFCYKAYIQGAIGGPPGAACIALQIYRMWTQQGKTWDNDKYAHCMFSCRAGKSCGTLLARAGGFLKEFLDCIGMGEPDVQDLKANKDGRQCAGGWLAISAPLGWINLAFRESCDECCRCKGHEPWKN